MLNWRGWPVSLASFLIKEDMYSLKLIFFVALTVEFLYGSFVAIRASIKRLGTKNLPVIVFLAVFYSLILSALEAAVITAGVYFVNLLIDE